MIHAPKIARFWLDLAFAVLREVDSVRPVRPFPRVPVYEARVLDGCWTSRGRRVWVAGQPDGSVLVIEPVYDADAGDDVDDDVDEDPTIGIEVLKREIGGLR